MHQFVDMKTTYWKDFLKTLHNINARYSQWRIQAVWETGIPFWVPKLWRPKNHFSSFPFSVIFQIKIHWKSDQRFPMHLIISKWLRGQKCRQEKNKEKKRCRSEKWSCVRVFSFTYVINLANILFYFSLFLTNLLPFSDVNSWHCFV